MSAPSGHPALRTRIAEALEALLSAESARSIAERMGRAPSTITRRGHDLREWPAEELLMLAAGDTGLGDAVRTYVAGEEQSGDARRVDDDLMEMLGSLGTTITQASEALRDRHCDLAEARRLLPIMRNAAALIACVELDLAEQIRRGVA